MKLQDQPPTPMAKSREPVWTPDLFKQLATLLLVIILMVVLFFQRENIISFSYTLAQYPFLKYAGVFIFSMAASAAIIIPLPGLALTSVFGAFGFGSWDPLWLGIASGLGATIGEITGYMLGYSGQMVIPENQTYQKTVGWMSRWGNLTIFLLALIPNPIFDMAGIVAGALKYPFWKYMLIGAAGRIPKHVLFAYLGFWGINLLPS